MNRLNLDFNLYSAAERTEFLNNYIQNITFKPTEDELETMANYILWGKSEDGTSAVDEGDIEIETRHSTWNTHPIESLDAIMSEENFTEAAIKPINYTASTRIPNAKFQRTDCSEELRTQLEPLWQQIDSLDLLLTFYDLAHEKRQKPPRAELLSKFTEEEITTIKDKAAHLNIYQYFKRRHLLVELRREQYTISDQYKPEPLSARFKPLVTEEFNIEIPAYPLGTYDPQESPAIPYIFRPLVELTPYSFKDSEISLIKQYVDSRTKEPPAYYFDYTNEDHIAGLLSDYREIKLQDPDNLVLRTLDYYIYESKLSQLQIQILQKKINHIRNQDISNQINQTYHTRYTVNYISTIYRKNIISEIAHTAALHYEIIKNLNAPQSFKKCNTCGKLLLLSDANFVHKTRAADGFANRCKNCDRDMRKALSRRKT